MEGGVGMVSERPLDAGGDDVVSWVHGLGLLGRSGMGKGMMKKRFMKRKFLPALGLLAPGLLAAYVTCRAGVYAQGIYRFGTTYYDVCSTTLPFAPYEYKLTEISWREDDQGSIILDLGRKPGRSDIHRRRLEVEIGSESFFLPLDSGPVKRFKSDDDPPLVKGAGDFATVVTQHLINHGSHPVTNALPVVQTSWICGAGSNKVVFVLEGDQFAAIQNLLERACGKPDETIQSSAGGGVNGKSINYSPAQIGVFLNLTRAFHDATIVSIVGGQSNMATEFRPAFKVASPSARRDLVMTAIDNGTIKRGMPLKELMFMFAEDFQIFYPRSQNDKMRAVVFFEPAKPAPKPMMSASQEGWYMDFIFSSDDRLEFYSLSNLHK